MTFSLQCKQVQEKKNEMTYKLINGKQTIFCNIENKSISFICLNEVTYIKTQSKYGLVFFSTIMENLKKPPIHITIYFFCILVF